MSNMLKTNKSAEEGTRDLLVSLLESEKVKGIFTLRNMTENGAVSYSLITDVEELKNASPLSPLMPVNAGKALSRFTLSEAPKEPVAAVLRPCELRAFFELVKRTQGNLDNLLLISVTCGGVFPLKTVTNGDFKKRLPSYWDSVRKADISPDIRPTCAACQHFVPFQADMTVALIGKNDLDKQCCIFINTKKGEEYAKGAPGSITSEEIETNEIQQLKEKRGEQEAKLFEECGTEKFNLQELVKTFAACLGCHGCSNACPICYCLLCDFDSKTHEYTISSYLKETEQKGGLRVPPETVFFHVGRLLHMGISCVSCGMCSDVCPVDIPVATIFTKTGGFLQEVFEYIPGKDVEETVPLGTFKTDEFEEIGE